MKNLVVLLALACGSFSVAQESESGPVISNFGKVFEVDAPSFKLDLEMEYRAVFDVVSSPEDLSQLNSSINTPARFLNMHAQSGVPVKNLKAAVVVHGAAFKDILSDTAYNKRFKTENPNRELVRALLSSGTQTILCGQTAAHRKIAKEDMIPGVQLALSAMTALVHLQNDNYQLIKF